MGITMYFSIGVHKIFGYPKPSLTHAFCLSVHSGSFVINVLES